MGPTPAARRSLLLGAVALLVAACGGGERGIEWGSPTAVFDAAMEATSKADLDALWPYLTPAGKVRAENDLRAWQLQLRDARNGPVILAEVRRLRPETTDAELEAARTGSIGDVWRLFLRAKPRPAKPQKTGLRLEADGMRAQVGYVDVHGTERVVILVRQGGRWRIDYLPL